jgi:O-antigen/teichoic acid export membrane protein
MDGEAILAVSAAVVALTQLMKLGGVPDKYGPLAVLGLAVLGVVFWGYSVGNFERARAFEYFAGWIAVATSAAGVFGFTRATTSAVTAAKAPPAGGAGSSPTLKEPLG